MSLENIKPIRDWMPGLPGKGFMLESGQVVIWNINADGHPEHAEKAQQMTGKRHDYTGAITIAPDGTACRASLLTNTPLPADGDEEAVAAANGRIKLVSDPEQVTKAKLHAYAHAENLAAIALRKTAPAKLAELPAEAATWLGKLKGDEGSKYNRVTGVSTPAKCDTWEFTFGTKTWTTSTLKEDEQARNLVSHLPDTCCPRSAEDLRRQTAGVGTFKGMTVWGPSTSWLRINVPFNTPQHLRGQIGCFLQAKLEEVGAASIIYYPDGAMPTEYSDKAFDKWMAKEDAKDAAREAAKKVRAGTPDECATVLAAMENLRNPDKYRTFNCTLDIEIAAGIPAERIAGVLETLVRKGKIHSGGFHTRAKRDGREIGSWWTISNPKPLSKAQ